MPMSLESLGPLCVDLDGTLVKTDLFFESLLKLIKKNPFCLFSLVLWAIQGKAYLKDQVAQRITLAVDVLPFNQELVEFLRQEGSKRNVVLCTGSNIGIANAVANHLQCFDEVISSTPDLNMTGTNKAEKLVEQYGESKFDYIGNDKKDWQVWEKSNNVLVASPSKTFIDKTRAKFKISKLFEMPAPGFTGYVKSIRVHHWIKNLLIFVPFVLEHRFLDIQSFLILCLCFTCFSCLASATYILNDLLDLEADRRNCTKKKRPFAAGLIPVQNGILLMVLLLLVTFILLRYLPIIFTAIVILYAVMTIAYSVKIKEFAILDVCFLAALYTLRVIGGSLAINVDLSFWLLAFCIFFFLSMALAKRVTELKNIEKKSGSIVVGRGYVTQDISMLISMGLSSGFLSVLVVAFYINSTKVMVMYKTAELLWLICPILIYWIGRMWLLTSRGRMHDDPVVFAIKDKISFLMFALCGLVVTTAILDFR